MRIIWTTSPTLYHFKAYTEEENIYTALWGKMLIMAKGDQPVSLATLRAEGSGCLAQLLEP